MVNAATFFVFTRMVPFIDNGRVDVGLFPMVIEFVEPDPFALVVAEREGLEVDVGGEEFAAFGDVGVDAFGEFFFRLGLIFVADSGADEPTPS